MRSINPGQLKLSELQTFSPANHSGYAYPMPYKRQPHATMHYMSPNNIPQSNIRLMQMKSEHLKMENVNGQRGFNISMTDHYSTPQKMN